MVETYAIFRAEYPGRSGLFFCVALPILPEKKNSMALKIGREVGMVSHERHSEILRIEYDHGPWDSDRDNVIIHFD